MVKDNQPLTKKDFLTGLMEFFEKVLAPYLDEHIEDRLDEIEQKLEEHDRRFDKLDDRLDRHGKQLETHEVRITKLEKVSPATL